MATVRAYFEAVSSGETDAVGQYYCEGVVHAFANGATVVVEASWEGILAVPIGEDTPAGTVMRARFARFYEFRDGRIAAQRNHDCFYTWK